jgi:SAM-dependent methyltransferase
MSLYQRLLGIPFVYDRVRPFVVGGIDMSPLFRNLEAGAGDVILDVGCGTGMALDYLDGFAAYHGFDTDPVAIGFARRKNGARQQVRFEQRIVTGDDVAAIQPTRVILSGLLHHLRDDQAVALLQACARVSSVKRIATSDVVYLPGELISNALAWMDRGKHVRRPDGYRDLAARAGWHIVRDEIVRSHPTSGKALYMMMALKPNGEPNGST